jgi:peptidoglycan/xylan/chitin deacetylase (PgdA/CDA1 family)
MKRNKLTILLYHGVADSPSNGIENFSQKHIPVEDFEAQIRFLNENCNILSMDDVVSIKKQGAAWPERAVAVTFDDGFKNNYTVAAPVLRGFRCPATFYICAGMINTDLMFWVDIIEDCINRSLKKEIKMVLEKPTMLPMTNRNDRIEAVTRIKKFCKTSSSAIKNRVISDLINATDIKPSSNASSNYKMMSWQDVKELNCSTLFSFGGHTLYHDIMAARAIEDLVVDIDATLKLINFNLKQTTTHFAYPEGQYNHYSGEVINALIERGISCCPSAVDGINTNEDLFNLKRIMPNFMGRAFPFSLG